MEPLHRLIYSFRIDRISPQVLAFYRNLLIEDGYFSVSAEGVPSPQKQIDFFYQGSILSQLEEAHLPRHLLEFKHFFCMFMHWIFFPRSCSGSGPELPKAGWGLREKVFLLFCMKSGSRNKPRSSIS